MSEEKQLSEIMKNENQPTMVNNNDSVVINQPTEQKEEKVTVDDIYGEEHVLPKDALEKDKTTPVRELSGLEKLMAEQDEEIEEAKKEYDIKKEQEAEAERERKNLEAQKNQFHDTVIEEEEESKDNDVAINTPDLTSIRIKKPKNLSKKFESILSNKKKAAFTTKVILPNSGYTASISGMTSPEIRTASETLSKLDKFGYLDYKYKNLYKKITNTSVGEISYDTFLKRTALLEYETLAYGLFASTYPDVNEYPFKCPKCGARTSFKFNNQQFLDIDFDLTENEKASLSEEELKKFEERRVRSKKIIDTMAATLRGQAVDAQALFDDAETNSIIRQFLPDSKIIVDLRHPTLYNQLFDVVQKLTDDLIDNNTAIVNMLPFIAKVYYPDPDSENMDDPDYLELIDVEQQIQALNTIDESDDEKLSEAIVSKIMEKYVINYSLKAPKCRCGYKPEPTKLQFDELLFTMRQIQSMLK